MKTIWCLFSIQNNYDQPNNNLECAWIDKPHFNQLKAAISVSFASDGDIGAILLGSSVQIGSGGDTYRLEEIELGKKL